MSGLGWYRAWCRKSILTWGSQRRRTLHLGRKHYYFMTLSSSETIDAAERGNAGLGCLIVPATSSTRICNPVFLI